jgi:hypothetical protein
VCDERCDRLDAWYRNSETARYISHITSAKRIPHGAVSFWASPATGENGSHSR